MLASASMLLMNQLQYIHIQDVDQRSNCQPLTLCLQQIREWSDRHPRHLPLFILLETKDDPLELKFPTVTPERFSSTTLDALDAEIRSVFPRGQYITPDDVRGHYPTVNLAIRKQGWPSLNAARGKVLFLLDQRKVTAAYLKGHPALRGRVMFTNSTPCEPDAAFVERNDGPASEITSLVRAGYLVRARTDAELKEAKSDDTRRRDAMMSSGAQLLSTDFPRNEAADSGYVVQFTGGADARCNPVLSGNNCRDADLRD
jgi:Phosphoinositide phospholipase C, Ca2+-dependent